MIKTLKPRTLTSLFLIAIHLFTGASTLLTPNSDKLYESLELLNTATEDEVRKAYRRLVLTCHPDKHPNDTVAETKFKEISEAYNALIKDKQKPTVPSKWTLPPESEIFTGLEKGCDAKNLTDILIAFCIANGFLKQGNTYTIDDIEQCKSLFNDDKYMETHRTLASFLDKYSYAAKTSQEYKFSVTNTEGVELENITLPEETDVKIARAKTITFYRKYGISPPAQALELLVQDIFRDASERFANPADMQKTINFLPVLVSGIATTLVGLYKIVSDRKMFSSQQRKEKLLKLHTQEKKTLFGHMRKFSWKNALAFLGASTTTGYLFSNKIRLPSEDQGQLVPVLNKPAFFATLASLMALQWLIHPKKAKPKNLVKPGAAQKTASTEKEQVPSSDSATTVASVSKEEAARSSEKTFPGA